MLWRLARLLRRRRIDAVVTVGTGGDKMFWGRLAGWLAGVPVICSALHSTGLPDHVELPNRLLAPLTDAFIAVAEPHAQYLAAHEGCPAEKIRVIPNGVDVERFHPRWPDRALQQELDSGRRGAGGRHRGGAAAGEEPRDVSLRGRAGPPEAAGGPVPGRRRRAAAGRSSKRWPRAWASPTRVRFLGTRSDVPEVLSLIDVVLLTSHMEANPICLLEAMASEKPVVATRVGSVAETVLDGRTGYLVAPGDSQGMADRVLELLTDRDRADSHGPRRPRTRHRPLVGRSHGRRLPGPDRRHLRGQVREVPECECREPEVEGQARCRRRDDDRASSPGFCHSDLDLVLPLPRSGGVLGLHGSGKVR